MNRIENLSDLRREIKRLQVVKASNEQALTHDIRELHESLKPANLVINTLRGFFETDSGPSGLLKSGVSAGVNLLIEKLLFRKSNFIVKTLMSYLGGNLANNLVKNNTGAIVEKVRDWVSSFIASRKKNRYFDSTYQEREIYNNEY
jgi:hypothetical protein